MTMEPLAWPPPVRKRAIKAGTLVYRMMRESSTNAGQPDSDGKPNRRKLALRPFDFKRKTIEPDFLCPPWDAGLSGWAEDPTILPIELRPSALSGTSPDPLWTIRAGAVTAPLQAVIDKHPHTLICLSEPRTFLQFDTQIRSTAPEWHLV